MFLFYLLCTVKMFANVEIKFLKLFIAFIFSLLCSRDDDQSETFKVSGNLDYECK